MKNEIEIKNLIARAMDEPKTPESLLEKTLNMAREFDRHRQMEKIPELKKDDIPVMGSGGGPLVM